MDLLGCYEPSSCFEAALQMCSPIIDISTSLPHCEHLTVGMKADSRGYVAIVGGCFYPCPVRPSSPDLARIVTSCAVRSHAQTVVVVSCPGQVVWSQ